VTTPWRDRKPRPPLGADLPLAGPARAPEGKGQPGRRPLAASGAGGPLPGGSTSVLLGQSGEGDAHRTAELAATSFHASPIGGGILIGRDADGTLRRAVLPPGKAARDPQPGETWRVTGQEIEHPLHGPQIHAEVALPLMPSGRAVIRYLATNRRFEGVGWATANRLWEVFGEKLYDLIRQRDVAAVAAAVGPARAVAIVEGFGLLAEEIEVFAWLDRYGVEPRTAAAAASLWGRGAIGRISADPYALSLIEPWRTVDDRAKRLGVALADRRRLLAAAEEALARRFARGHTAATRNEALLQVGECLGLYAAKHANEALDMAVEAGRLILHPDGLLQGRAAWFMEREVERRFRERLERPHEAPAADDVEAAIASVEASEGYRLGIRQREAVHMAVSCALSALSGAAGTGKTAVVKAILAAADLIRERLAVGDRSGFECPQMALAGRAARRMTQATGRPAETVSRFLRRLEVGRTRIERGLAVLDEASMLDLRVVYRLLVKLPPLVDLLFVGDPAQLSPIGPGLVFHRMVESDAIPQVRLDVIHRQAEATGIAAVANEIREGRLPALPRFDPANPFAPGVFFVPATETSVADRSIDVFRAMAGAPPRALKTDRLHELDIQVICPMKSGAAGSRALNREIETLYMAGQPRVHDWGLSIGSKVMWLKNDYGKAPLLDEDAEPLLDPVTGDPVFAGFMNGALGTVCRETGRGAWVAFDDGAEDEIRQFDLERLTLGWAISIHKAQGSAFRRVVVPLTRSRLLDRAMIYTAVSRGVETVVLIGDPQVFRLAVEASPRANMRRTTLAFRPT